MSPARSDGRRFQTKRSPFDSPSFSFSLSWTFCPSCARTASGSNNRQTSAESDRVTITTTNPPFVPNADPPRSTLVLHRLPGHRLDARAAAHELRAEILDRRGGGNGRMITDLHLVAERDLARFERHAVAHEHAVHVRGRKIVPFRDDVHAQRPR